MKPDYRVMHKHLTGWEGGLSRDFNDKASKNPCPATYQGKTGWHTNRGVTWPVFVKYCSHIGAKPTDYDRFFKLTVGESEVIFKVGFWDKLNLDNAPHQVVANIFSQWAWGSGVTGGLSVAKDFFKYKEQVVCNSWNDVLKYSIVRMNKVSIEILFQELMDFRMDYLISISKPGTKNNKFRKGWLSRHASFYKFNKKFL